MSPANLLKSSEYHDFLTQSWDDIMKQRNTAGVAMLVCYFPHLLTCGILIGWIHRTLRADWPDSVHMLHGWSFDLLHGLELETWCCIPPCLFCLNSKLVSSRAKYKISSAFALELVHSFANFGLYLF